jgi:WD40 repeat protein
VLDTPDGYTSIQALVEAHTALLQAQRDESRDDEALHEIADFLRRGRATGVLLDADADRRVAQSLLDYWTTFFYRAHQRPPDSILAPYDRSRAPQLSDERCPFHGLQAFYPKDSGGFFGRDALVRECLDALARVPLLIVIGFGGSGKSSVVRAGLLPALARGRLADSQTWRQYTMVPGSKPLVSLARALRPADADSEWDSQQAAAFQDDPHHLRALLDELAASPAILVVDQLEDLFTLCEDDSALQAFVDNLLDLVELQPVRHRLVLVLRAEFEERALRLSALQRLLGEEGAHVEVAPMEPESLRQTIENAAISVGLKFEAGLVNQLVRDVSGEPEALPLLQFTLLRLWESRDRNRITWDAYVHLGGPRRALADAAEQLYQALTPDDQRTAERILLYLAYPTPLGGVTSRRVRRDSLYEPDEAHEPTDRVLARLEQAHLVRVTPGATAADEQVELAHEALVRSWNRLAEPVREKRRGMRRRLQLTGAAARWQESKYDEDALWRGKNLEAALRYRDLTALESEFLRASSAAEQSAHRRQVRRLSAVAGALMLLLLMTAITAAFAIRFWREAEDLRRVADTRRMAAQALYLLDSQPNLAALLGVAAYENDRTSADARGALLAVLGASRGVAAVLPVDAAVRDFAFSADGQQLTSLHAGGAVQRWSLPTADPADHSLPQALPRLPRPNSDLALSNNARTVALVGEDRLIYLRDIATGRQQPLPEDTRGASTAVFSPSAEGLALLLPDDTIYLWDFGAGQSRRLSGGLRDVTGLVFSLDGAYLAAGNAHGKIQIWNVSNGESRSLDVHADLLVNAVALSREGALLAAAYQDGTIRLWDVNTGQPQSASLGGFHSEVNTMAFSPDGVTLAAGGKESVGLWDVPTGRFLGLLSGRIGPVRKLAFSSRSMLAAGGEGAFIHVWDARVWLRIHDLPETVTATVLSSDGSALVLGSSDGAVRLWGVAGEQLLRPPLRPDTGHGEVSVVVADGSSGVVAWGYDDGAVYLGGPGASDEPRYLGSHDGRRVTSIALGPGATVVASGSCGSSCNDGEIRLWNVADGTPSPTVIPVPGSGRPASLAFGPRALLLASGLGNGDIWLWDRDQGRAFRYSDPTTQDFVNRAVQAVAFSSDGSLLASGGADHTVRLWEVGTKRPQGAALSPYGPALKGHGAMVTGVAFGADGILASTDGDGAVRLWTVQTGLPQGELLPRAETAATSSVAFDQSGSRLTVGRQDGALAQWELDPEKAKETVCRLANRPIAETEQRGYFGNGAVIPCGRGDISSIP